LIVTPGHIFLHPENFAVSVWSYFGDLICLGFKAPCLAVTSHKKWNRLAASFALQLRLVAKVIAPGILWYVL
jgi:hypothetical protein